MLDGGECQIGLESTIVAFDGAKVRLLRPGAVTAGQLRGVVGEALPGPPTCSPARSGQHTVALRAQTPMRIVPSRRDRRTGCGAPRAAAGASRCSRSACR